MSVSIYPGPTRQEVIDLLHMRKDHLRDLLPVLKYGRTHDDQAKRLEEIKQVLSMINSSTEVEDIIRILQDRQEKHVTRDDSGKAATFFQATPEYTEVSYILGRITGHKAGVRRIDDE